MRGNKKKERLFEAWFIWNGYGHKNRLHNVRSQRTRRAQTKQSSTPLVF